MKLGHRMLNTKSTACKAKIHQDAAARTLTLLAFHRNAKPAGGTGFLPLPSFSPVRPNCGAEPGIPLAQSRRVGHSWVGSCGHQRTTAELQTQPIRCRFPVFSPTPQHTRGRGGGGGWAKAGSGTQGKRGRWRRPWTTMCLTSSHFSACRREAALRHIPGGSGPIVWSRGGFWVLGPACGSESTTFGVAPAPASANRRR